MKLLFDFFPILLFFIAYKLYGIYTATAVAIAASFLQMVFYWLKHRRFERMHVITFFLILILGGATLFLHDEMFIKWKPTVLNWAFAIVFLSSQYLGAKPLIQRMMESNVSLPQTIWRKLNSSWVAFFTAMGVVNLYVVYNFDTDTWVNFKLFGILGMTIAFIILQAIYMTRHITPENTGSQGS